MKQLKLLIAFLITTQQLFAQINIQIEVKQSKSKQAKLFLHKRSETVLIDSSSQISSGLFIFNLPAGYTQGLYKVAIGNNSSFDFIVASESKIALETVVFAIEDSLKSIESRENKIFFQYQKIKKQISQKMWYINSLKDSYPDSSNFHMQLVSELTNLQTELYNESKKLATSNPEFFVSKLILLELKPTISAKELQKKNWWVDVNLNDSRLVNSSALDSKIWGFIDLYYDEKLDKEQQDSSFIACVKTIMKLDANTAIKAYLRNSLFTNYLNTDYDATTKYLYETSFEGLPTISLSPEERNSFDIQGKNGVDTKAQDFNITKAEGSKIKLSKIKTPYKLVVFWSMWCPHCTEMMPEIYEIYKKFKEKGFEVIAVSIDDEIDGWKKFVNDKNYGWINTIVPDNGSNKIISEYNVDGTPKLFLLDKNLTIISRPTNAKQLEAKLKSIIK